MCRRPACFGLAYSAPLHTSYAYNANNQLIRQTQQLDEDAVNC